MCLHRFRFLSLALFLQCAYAQPPGSVRPWSAGGFIMTDSQPYRGADGNTRVLPFLSYQGPRLAWYGPFVRYQVANADPLRISLRGQVDFGAYDESDAPILSGLGDRPTTLLLGLGADWSFHPSWSAALSVDRDALNRHEGLEAVLSLNHRIGHPRAPFSATLSSGLRFQDKRWTTDRVGVPADRAREDRPAYAPDVSLHPYLGSMMRWRPRQHWNVTAALRYEWLDDTWRDSPLISDGGRLTSMFTVSYSF